MSPRHASPEDRRCARPGPFSTTSGSDGVAHVVSCGARTPTRAWPRSTWPRLGRRRAWCRRRRRGCRRVPPIRHGPRLEGMVVPEMIYVADDVVPLPGTARSPPSSRTRRRRPRRRGARPRRVDAAARVAEATPRWRPAAPAGGRPRRQPLLTYTVSTGDPDRAFAAAHRVVALDVRQTRLAGVPLEPRAVAARWRTARSPSGPRRRCPTGSATRWRGCWAWRPSACG